MNALTFNNVPLNVVQRNNQTYITSADLAKALQYADESSINKIYTRNQDEFTDQMSLTVKLTVNRKTSIFEKDTRIFSLRGAHLIAMLSRTPIAKEFRKWVLDILDKEATQALTDDTASQQQYIVYRPKTHEVEDGVLHTLFNLLFLAEAQAEQLRNLEIALHGTALKLSPTAYSLHSETSFEIRLKSNSLKELLTTLSTESAEWQKTLVQFNQLRIAKNKQSRLAIR